MIRRRLAIVIVLVGESGCGKSSLAKRLSELKPSFSKVVTYTTRPMRTGETDGIDYHFIDNDTFDDLKQKGFFFEYAQYREWQYGTAANFNKDEDKIIILTPAGARALRRYAAQHNLLDFIRVVYLNVDRRSRLVNILKRGDNIEEAYRRSLSDVGQFDSFDKEADKTLYNENYVFSIDELCKILITYIEIERKENEQNI